MNQDCLKPAVAEFIGTFALIFVGVWAIHNNTPEAGVGLLGVALAQGLTIAVMVSAHWNNPLVYGAGSMLGGAVAGLTCGRFLIKSGK